MLLISSASEKLNYGCAKSLRANVWSVHIYGLCLILTRKGGLNDLDCVVNNVFLWRPVVHDKGRVFFVTKIKIVLISECINIANNLVPALSFLMT